MSLFQQRLRLCQGASVAVENTAQSPAERPNVRSEIVPAFAIVQDHIQFQLGGEFELCGENMGLMRPPFCKGKTLWWRMKIIQSHFAKGADFGMLCQLSQFVDPCVAADGIRIARVDADGNTYIRFAFDEAEQLARVIEVCRRGDHARDSCRSGTFEHGGEIGVELLAT